MTSSYGRTLLALVVALAILTRFALALYNTESNDDHMEVVSLMIEGGGTPLVNDCWECYQPKLFHRTVALTSEGLGIGGAEARRVVAQMLNAGAGSVTVLLLWLIAARLDVSSGVKLAAFALAALNPGLITINAQATNDTFVILFGTATILFFDRWLHRPTLPWLAAVLVGLIMASLSKVQGLVLFAMIETITLLRGLVSIDPRQRRIRLAAAAFMAVAYIATVPFIGPYWSHYRMTGTPLPAALNAQPVEPPALIRKTEVKRPGVRSVTDAYLTFRILDLLKEPFVRGGGYAEHRTSLWSQLYARSQFSRFAAWPPSWRSREPHVLNVGRAALVLGLIPLTLLLASMASDIRRFLEGMATSGSRVFEEDSRWVATVLCCGMLFMVAKYSYDQRDFSTMKPIFVYPVIGAFMIVFARGMARCLARLCGRPVVGTSVYVVIVLLVATYLTDIGILVADLRRAGLPDV